MHKAYINSVSDAELLDNPLWSSLATLHRGLALSAGEVLRYPADVAPFLAVPAADLSADAAIAELVAPGETVFLVGPRPAVPSGWTLEELGTILQMVCARVPAIPDGPPLRELATADRADVLALAALVYPHYFRPRTPELGRYLGIHAGTTLAAMAGERMGMPGFRELSAVCTHPDFVGRGLARRLLLHLATDIAATSTPFLHVSPNNARAVQLYEQNGFVTRRALAFSSLTRTSRTSRRSHSPSSAG